MAAMRTVSHDAGRQVACQYKCEHFEVSAKTGENVMLSLITMVKMMMTMATEHNSPTNVIHYIATPLILTTPIMNMAINVVYHMYNSHHGNMDKMYHF